MRPGVAQHPAYGGVAGGVELEDALGGELVVVRRLQQPDQPRRRDDGLEAAAVAAAAHLAVLADLHVADLAGDAAGAAVQPPAEHDAGAEAAGHLDVEHVAGAAGHAVVELGQGAEVGVVVGVDGQAEPALELLARAAGPASPGRIPVLTLADRRSSGAGTHMPTACRSVRAQPRGRRAGPDHAGRPVERLGAVGVDVDQGELLGQHLAGAVGDRDPDVPVTDVDAGHPSGRRAERDQHRRASAAALVRSPAVGRLGDPAGADQLGDQARDGGARQAGAARQVGPAHRAVGREHRGDRAAVGRPQPLEGARACHAAEARPISAQTKRKNRRDRDLYALTVRKGGSYVGRARSCAPRARRRAPGPLGSGKEFHMSVHPPRSRRRHRAALLGVALSSALVVTLVQASGQAAPAPIGPGRAPPDSCPTRTATCRPRSASPTSWPG